MRHQLRQTAVAALVVWLLVSHSAHADDTASAIASAQDSAPIDVSAEQAALIPKRETGVDQFLQTYPDYDGRGTVIAVFDTGVDPAAAGLQVTTTGERKLVDVIDASGAGDVAMGEPIAVDPGATVTGISGRALQLPQAFESADGTVRLGVKRADELFHRRVHERLQHQRAEDWARLRAARVAARKRAERTSEGPSLSELKRQPPSELTAAERDRLARARLLETLEADANDDDPGAVFDCVLWHDGTHFHAVVDTDADGDLADETVLRPFGVDGEYATFGGGIASNFAIQVYDDGDVLSIVTVSGSHGSHVAAIAAAHFPENSARNGIAPGARILSVRIGDLRVGGSSDLTGELRAIAAAAQYGVDIANVSWGGTSSFQDGSEYSVRLYNRLVEEYGVSAFISAGNSGPALSTLGSPGGEASRVIGVGAYVSEEMGRVLYRLLEANPDAAFQFTSRGPAKNGDLGVDVMAPGAAQASLAFDALQQSERYNGTSMSAPSAAGVGALLLSAAKDLGIGVTPARMRYALINSATSLEDVEVWAQGAGLIQALPALEHLKRFADQRVLDVFFDVETPVNSFHAGPGVYLRGQLAGGARALPIEIRPEFSEAATPQAQFALEEDLILETDASWISVPEYARLTAGRLRFEGMLQLPEDGTLVRESPWFGRIHARLARAPEAGPLVTVPVTIVAGDSIGNPDDPRAPRLTQFTARLEPGRSTRRFFANPPGATRLELRVERPASERLPRRYVIHGLTPIAHREFGVGELRRYIEMHPGDELSTWLPVVGDTVTELNLHQRWSSAGNSRLRVRARHFGVTSVDSGPVVFEGNQRYATVTVRALSDVTVEPSARLTHAVYAKLPDAIEWLPGDDRARLPAGPDDARDELVLGVRQRFDLTLDEPTTIEWLPGRPFDVFQEFGGNALAVYHASGDFLGWHFPQRRSTLELPKGTIHIYRTFETLERDRLERERTRPLRYRVRLAKPLGVEVFADFRSAVRDAPTTRLELVAGRHHALTLAPTAVAELVEFEPSPDHFVGEFELVYDGEPLLSTSLQLHAREDFESPPEPRERPNRSAPTSAVERSAELTEQLVEARFAAVKRLRRTSDAELAAFRDRVLDELIQAHPQRPELYLERARIAAAALGIGHALEASGEHDGEAGAEGAADGADAEVPGARAAGEELDAEAEREGDAGEQRAEIESDLDRARALADPAAVASYFGAPPLGDSEDAAERRALERLETRRKRERAVLFEVALLRCALQLAADDVSAARSALTEAERWREGNAEAWHRQAVEVHRAAGHYGLALEIVRDLLDDDPRSRTLLGEQQALLESLGWDLFVEREALRARLREHERARLPTAKP